MRKRKYVRRAGLTRFYPTKRRDEILTDLSGLETIKYGHEEIEVWPKFCEKTPYHDCLQCSLTGMIPCAPRFRELVKV